MEKLNRKGFFSTLFGGIAGVVAGSTVKASEPSVPTPPVENVVTPFLLSTINIYSPIRLEL